MRLLLGGFERPVLVFTLRTALAASAALLLGWFLGLEHPQWSAMTVWATSQPVRGQALEKGAYRLAGTAVGVLAGVGLVLLSGDSVFRLVAGLAVWIALCTALGHLLRGFAVYGVILSGYSASMVALLDNGRPDLVVGLGVDRFLTIATGVVVAVAVSLVFAPKGGPGGIAQAIRQVTARLLRLMGDGHDAEAVRAQTRTLLSEIAALEEKLEPHGAGSLKGRRFVRGARGLFMAEVEILLRLRGPRGDSLPEAARAAFRCAGDDLAAERSDAAVLAGLDAAVAAVAGNAAFEAPAGRLRAALANQLGIVETAPNAAGPLVVLHTDWRGARSAAARAFLAMLVVGLFWAFSGIETGPFLLLGLSIMISLFSTFENPAQFMVNVMCGQALGAAGALACRWLVWPHVEQTTLALVVAMIPFILLGAFVMAHGRTRVLGFDYNMVSLLLLQPVVPLQGGFAHSLALAAAVVVAPALALVAYRLLPVDARRRGAMVARAMLAELKEMAVSSRPINAQVRRARLHHRLLRLVQFGEKAGFQGGAAVDRGFVIYGLGEILIGIREKAERDGRLERGLALVLRRVAEIDRRPDRVARACEQAASRLRRTGAPEAADLAAVAAALRRQAPFLSTESR